MEKQREFDDLLEILEIWGIFLFFFRLLGGVSTLPNEITQRHMNTHTQAGRQADAHRPPPIEETDPTVRTRSMQRLPLSPQIFSESQMSIKYLSAKFGCSPPPQKCPKCSKSPENLRNLHTLGGGVEHKSMTFVKISAFLK